MPVIVKCTRGAGDKEGPSISDALLTSQHAATLRGRRWLDDPSKGAYYLTTRRVIRVPHYGSHIVPGSWVSVTAGMLGMNEQKVRVTGYEITITPSSVWATMETEQYEELTA